MYKNFPFAYLYIFPSRPLGGIGDPLGEPWVDSGRLHTRPLLLLQVDCGGTLLG
jgi:hypothetical protein